MPLMLDAPPFGAERVIDAAIQELIGHGAVAMGNGAKPTVASPLPLFHLGADAIAAGKDLQAAEQIGWLAPLQNGGEVLGGLELARVKRPKDGAPAVRFASFSSGPLQRGLAEALATAERAARRKDLRVTLLRAPAVYLFALWLSGADGDVLVPIPPAPPPLKPYEPISAQQGLEDLRAAAKAALDGDDMRN
jgi:hypothetical protein